MKVLIVDDLLATGGTVKGTIELIERLKGDVVGLAFLVELDFLKGRDRLESRRVTSVIQYGAARQGRSALAHTPDLESGPQPAPGNDPAPAPAVAPIAAPLAPPKMAPRIAPPTVAPPILAALSLPGASPSR